MVLSAAPVGMTIGIDWGANLEKPAKKQGTGKGSAKRGALPKTSEEMKRWAALLEDELRGWPGVRFSRMFGMVACYRGDAIFALLPGTRGIGGPNCIGVKPRPEAGTGKMWEFFAVESEGGLSGAIERLGEAYEKAGR